MVKEVVYRIMEKQEQNGLVIEEMMFYFLQAAQIDDKVTITPSIIAEPDVELIWTLWLLTEIIPSANQSLWLRKLSN